MSEAATPDVSVEEADEVNVTQVVEAPTEQDSDGDDSADDSDGDDS